MGCTAALMRSVLGLVVVCLSCGDSRATVTGRGTGTEERRLEPSATVELSYDAEGQLTSIERGGARTEWSYDALGRPREARDALGGRTTVEHDLAFGPIAVTDARGVATRYTRDGFGEVMAVSSGDTGDTRKAFDEAGNLVSVTDARGATTTLSYDELNRLIRARTSLPGATDSESTFTYDDDAGLGALATATFPGGRSDWAYDLEGRLARATQLVGAVTSVTEYGFDEVGRVAWLRYPSGRRLTFVWSADAVSALQLEHDGGVQTLIDEVDGARGQLEQLTWHLNAERRHQRRTFDTAGRPLSYPIGDGARVLRFDAAGRVVAYRHVVDGGEPASGSAAVAAAMDEDFTYDALDRLVGFSSSGVSAAVSYDAVGNRTSLDASGRVQALTTEPTSNRLLGLDAGVEQRVFAYDEVGNVLADGRWTARYDSAGRLESATRDGVTVFATYDSAGRRVRKTTGADDVVFVYDKSGHLLGEYDPSGRAVREYVWLGATLIGFFLRDDFFFVQVDHLGAPRVAVDVEGRVRWSWFARPFGDGEHRPFSSAGVAPLDTFDLPLRFPGQYADRETGLFDNHHRTYDPETGRFVQSDPSGLAGGLNLYAYVEGNPLTAVDPEGLAKLNLLDPYAESVGDAALYWLAEEDADVSGLLTVYGHGNPNTIRDSSTGHHFQLDADALANRIKNSGKWKPGMPVRLMSCNVGNGKGSLVYRLADKLGVPVTGPDSLLWGSINAGNESGFYPAPFMDADGLPGPGGRFVTARPGRRRR